MVARSRSRGTARIFAPIEFRSPIGIGKATVGIPLRQPQSRGEVAALRRATQTQCPLGQPNFVEELEAKFAVCLRPLPPGRPPKKSAQSEVAPAEIARHAGQPA